MVFLLALTKVYRWGFRDAPALNAHAASLAAALYLTRHVAWFKHDTKFNGRSMAK